MSVPVSVVLTQAAAWVSDTLRADTSLGVSSTTETDVFATLACLTTVGRSIVFTRGGYPSVRRAHERFWRACDDAIKAGGNPATGTEEVFDDILDANFRAESGSTALTAECKVSRDTGMAIETLALFVRVWLGGIGRPVQRMRGHG
jgi:hypothetical protein